MKRILFVDDEPRILEGLQRTLRGRRREWEMHFAEGGAAALALLKKTTIDIVVTDMQMPGMDGASLLQCIHECYPHVMRIILSGHFNAEAGLRAVPVAHQFLTKPCDPEKLRAVIERCPPSAEGLPGSVIRRVVSAVGSLPSLPATCASLMVAIEDPAASMAAISRIIEQDVAITAKVLQLANSAFFSLSQEMTDVKTCVAFLGAEVLRQLVLSAQVLRRFKPERPLRGFSLEGFEKHSVLTAKIAAQLQAPGDNFSLCATTAFLHDVGKLVLASELPSEFERACLLSRDEKVPLYQAEERVLGANHAEIGALLVNLWGLPSATVTALAGHHRPSETTPNSADPSLLAIVHIANSFAHDLARGPESDTPDGSDLDFDYIKTVGLADRIDDWRLSIRHIAP